MTPREKAYKLVDFNYKIIWYKLEKEHDEVFDISKQLALNTVDIILNYCESKNWENDIVTKYLYWQDVKSEINKL